MGMGVGVKYVAWDYCSQSEGVCLCESFHRRPVEPDFLLSAPIVLIAFRRRVIPYRAFCAPSGRNWKNAA